MYAVGYNAAIQNNVYLLAGKMFTKCYRDKGYKIVWIIGQYVCEKEKNVCLYV